MKAKKNIDDDIKEWFVIVDHQQCGPFSLFDLKRKSWFTPDILVWKKGFKEWIQARFIPEMKSLFKDEPENDKKRDVEDQKEGKKDLHNESLVALTMQQDPYQFILWILLILLILIYTLYLQFDS